MPRGCTLSPPTPPRRRARFSSSRRFSFQANYGHEFAVRALIKVKADLKYANEDGMDVLMLAVQAGHKQLVQMLLVQEATARMDDAKALATDKNDFEMVGILTVSDVPSIQLTLRRRLPCSHHRSWARHHPRIAGQGGQNAKEQTGTLARSHPSIGEPE